MVSTHMRIHKNSHALSSTYMVEYMKTSWQEKKLMFLLDQAKLAQEDELTTILIIA
jgi:hypothetical protein